MTTRTIEFEETRTVERELTLCDNCQNEVDPNGSLYTDSSNNYADLHFCSKCLSELSEDIDDPETTKLKEWWNRSWTASDITRTTKDRLEEGHKVLTLVFLVTTVAGPIMAI